MSWDALTQPFMIRGLLAGCFFAVSCGFLGVFLVLRRASLIGEGLAHFSFGMVGLALCLGLMPMWVAVPMAIVGALIVLELAQNGRRYGDAAIGMLSAAGVSLGLILAKVGRGFITDLYSYLFGDILTVSADEMWLSISVSVMVFMALLLFFNELFVSTFDPDYAQFQGIGTVWLNRLLAVLTGLTVVVGIKIMGVMLVSAMIIFPVVTALELVRSFRAVVLTAGVVSLVSVFCGMIGSWVFDLPTGAVIVAASLLFFVLAKISRLFR